MYSKLQNKTTLFSTVRIQMQNIFRLLKMKMHTFIKSKQIITYKQMLETILIT